jgi:5-methyltetrahydrofolate--homocysteine methyltransferase
MNKELIKAISTLQEDEAIRLVQQALARGEDPNSLISDCQEGLRIVGDCYAKSEYYLPELIMSGEMIKKIFAKI